MELLFQLLKKKIKQRHLNKLTEANGGRVFASPLAKKIAQEKGINLSQIKGTGENGRITRKDVEGFTPSAVAQVATPSNTEKTASPVATFIPSGVESVEEVKNSQMRKTIAKRLSESKFTAPHYYLGFSFAN